MESKLNHSEQVSACTEASIQGTTQPSLQTTHATAYMARPNSAAARLRASTQVGSWPPLTGDPTAEAVAR